MALTCLSTQFQTTFRFGLCNMWKNPYHVHSVGELTGQDNSGLYLTGMKQLQLLVLSFILIILMSV
jgi:hypothetical protein